MLFIPEGRIADAAVARAAPQFTADMDLLAQYAPRVPTESGGYLNIVTHANPQTAFLLKDGKWIAADSRTLARFIKGVPEFTGQPVRLVACNAGGCANGLAQNLANKLGVRVEAPTGDVFVDTSGSFWTNGQWSPFTPGPK